MGSMDRMQPLLVAATTAPGGDGSFGADMHREMVRVKEDPDRAPHVFTYILNLPLDADIYDERNWYVPNPALGDFLSLEEMRRMALEARNDPVPRARLPPVPAQPDAVVGSPLDADAPLG